MIKIYSRNFVLIIFQKTSMLESLLRVAMLSFMKVIHIQLSNERREIAVFEVSRQDIITEA